MIGNQTIGGLDPNLVRQAANNIRQVTEDDLIACECGCTDFYPVIRFAKSKVDLVNWGVGMVNDSRIRAVCSNCGKYFPMNINEMKSKRERAELSKVTDAVIIGE